jgi:DnaJ family protein B protein 12
MAGRPLSGFFYLAALIESLNQKPQSTGDHPQPTDTTHTTTKKAGGTETPSANGEAGGGESAKGYTSEQVAAVKR